MKLPVVKRGKRAVISGRTGSGKTTLAKWLIERSPGRWVALNPKWTSIYKTLPGVVNLTEWDFDAIDNALQKSRFVNVQLPGSQSEPEMQDLFVEQLHECYKNVGLVVDELYTLHVNGRPAGPGLVGYLTRGRELGQSFIGLTQRPAWVSRFVYSEADDILTMTLNLKDDRKRIVEATGQEIILDKKLDTHYFYHYRVSVDKLTLFKPLPLRKG